MQGAENGVVHYAASVQYEPEILCCGFQKGFVAKGGVHLSFQFALPKGLCLGLTSAAKLVDDSLPGPMIELFVVGSEIGFGERQSQSRFAGGFVFGVKEFFSVLLLVGSQADPLAVG